MLTMIIMNQKKKKKKKKFFDLLKKYLAKESLVGHYIMSKIK